MNRVFFLFFFAVLLSFSVNEQLVNEPMGEDYRAQSTIASELSSACADAVGGCLPSSETSLGALRHLDTACSLDGGSARVFAKNRDLVSDDWERETPPFTGRRFSGLLRSYKDDGDTFRDYVIDLLSY